MINISKLEFVSELNSISKQKDNGICLFLGAGADISSGGVLFSELKKESVSYVHDRIIHEFESNDIIDKEFDNIIESLDEQARCMVVENLIKKTDQWLPSDGYKLLILLAKENCISSAITTNFTNILEISQQLIGVDAFQIFTPATAIPAQYLINSKSHKSIYLKMHGDINGRLITHLTSAEIDNKLYQSEFVKLFEYLIQNETLVFLGYSGWDARIAEIFKQNISTIKSVYWCNISKPDEDAPLVKVFRSNNIKIKYLNYNFDESLQIIAKEFFKDRTLFHADSIFIWALIEAKIKIIQADFFKYIDTESKTLLPVQRTKASVLDDFMLNSYKNFCVVTGNSGMGKSMLMSEFCKAYIASDSIEIIPLNVMTPYSDNLLDYIVKKLGYTSKDPYTVLYQFSRWANEQSRYFVFVIDNLGNYIGIPKEIAALLNKLIELAYAIRGHQNIKFVITLRTNIWNEVYNLLDSNYLNSIIWNDYKDNDKYAVRLGNFDSNELERAKSNILSLSNTSEISDDMIELIKEPSLYGLIQQNIYSLKDIEELNIQNVFEKTFFNGFNKKILEKLSYSLFCKNVTAYMPSEFTEESKNYLRNNDTLKNILSIEENIIGFKNDLVFECCLSSYFSSTGHIDIFMQHHSTFEDDYLSNQMSPPMYNGIIRYLAVGCSSFGKVVKLIYVLLEKPLSKHIIKFVNNVFKYMAKYKCKEYCDNVCNFNTNSVEFSVLLPFIIHSTGFMKEEYAFILLSFLLNKDIHQYRLECSALINDRFSMGIRKNNTPQNAEVYFHSYIKYMICSGKPSISLFSLIWIMGRIGRDNTPVEIYSTISKLIVSKIKDLSIVFGPEEINQVKNLLLENAYFIFFNSENDLDEQYYLYPQKSKLIPIINMIKEKKNLKPEQLSTICSLIDHFGETIEFFIGNMIFVYMGSHNLEYVLENLDTLYENFDDNTTVLEFDFYSSALFLACYINNPLNRKSYEERYNRMVNDYEMKMFISPSMERITSCRKFEDKFNIEFEDGFNNFTAYTHTAPMVNYISKSSKISIDIYLSTLWRLLEKLDKNGMYDEMIRIVQSLNQMSVSWPEEALEALNKFGQYNHPLIRKAVIRTLKENYLRYPTITTQFLNHTGEAFSEAELLDIYSASNSQIENHVLEQLQWGRMIYFIKEYLNPQILDVFFEILPESNTLDEVLSKLINSIIS